MIPEIDFALVSAAVVCAIAGASITAAVNFVMHRRKSRNEAAPDTQEQTVFLYSTNAPLNAGIILASRRGQ